MRLLLLEDDVMIGETVLDLLRAEQYAVDWVKDGDAADTALRTQQYDLVLLDLGVPRRDGLDVLRALRSDDRTRLIPIVVLTSSAEEQDLVRSYGLGANSYVRKPVDFTQFVEAVRQLGLYWLVINQAAPQ